jgi:hypothetical protein
MYLRNTPSKNQFLCISEQNILIFDALVLSQKYHLHEVLHKLVRHARDAG